MKTPTWLDSSAILTLLCADPGTEIVRDRLERAERKSHTVFASTLTLTEIIASIARVHGEEAAREDLRLIREMPLQFLSPSADDCAAAGWLRAQHKLSTADAIIAAQALAAKAELIHKDPELESIPDLKHLKLPYKKTRH
jgi:predicted nucleic acid-binding protein